MIRAEVMACDKAPAILGSMPSDAQNFLPTKPFILPYLEHYQVLFPQRLCSRGARGNNPVVKVERQQPSCEGSCMMTLPRVTLRNILQNIVTLISLPRHLRPYLALRNLELGMWGIVIAPNRAIPTYHVTRIGTNINSANSCLRVSWLICSF